MPGRGTQDLPAPQDLPRSTRADAQPTLVRIIINGTLRSVPRPTRDNAISVFRRSLAVALSYRTQTRLQATAKALLRRAIDFRYTAIPAWYPLRGTFDFAPRAQRSLFEYAAHCAAAGRLWIDPPGRIDSNINSTLPVATEPRCPVGKISFEQLAALHH